MKLGSAADLHRRFRTGRSCLDLVHTGGEGTLARWEIVHSPADLGRLLGVILGLPALPADEADLAAMRPLRAAITRIAYGIALDAEPFPADADPRRAEIIRIAREVAGGSTSHPADVAAVNEAAAHPPLVRALRPEGGTAVVAPTAAAALATLARDAVDLFGGPLAHRTRICAADNCGLLFVDTSRPGQRRWCSMERCGNRAKIRTHRARSGVPPADQP
jgi:hypothetical protein